LDGGCGLMSEVGGGVAGQPGGSGRADRPGGSGRADRRGSEAVLARAFVRLADTLASDFDIVDFLQGLSADSVEILGAEAAGVMLADPRGGLRLIASSDERMRMLELFELQGAQGPCLDAFATGRAVQASAADSLLRWPVFAPQASGAGFQMMCAVPLRVRTDIIGALNLFRATDELFTDAEMGIAQAMGEMAAIGLVQERALRERTLLTEQLQAALTSRVIIEQAKGMLAEYLTMTVDDAFLLLRNYSRNRNRKLSHVASDVVSRKIPSTALITGPGRES
jgi:transcriptional regulator with GAF, ATPase, and Fis domain